MAPWCCFAPVPQRPSVDGAAAEPAGDLVGDPANASRTSTKYQSPRQRGAVVVVKTKFPSEVSQLETKGSDKLGTETAASADEFDMELPPVHASRHSQPRVSAQAPSRSSTASGINMLCVPPILTSGGGEQLQEEEQDIVAPLPSSPSMRMEHPVCLSHLSHTAQHGPLSSPIIISTFSINSQSGTSPRGVPTDKGVAPGLATAGLLSPTNIQLGIARMRATAFDVLTGAVKTQDVAKAYQQMGQSPWGHGGTTNMAELLHGGMMYAGLHTGSPVVLRQNLHFASPVAGSVQVAAPVTSSSDLVQQKSPTAYCLPVQVPQAQYTSSPNLSQHSGTSCASPGMNSLAGSAASPFGGLQTPSSKPPRVPTRSSAGTVITPQSAEAAMAQAAGQGSCPAASVVIAPSPASPVVIPGTSGLLSSPRDTTQVDGSTRAVYGQQDAAARSVSSTPQPVTAQLSATLPATYTQLHAGVGNRHVVLSSLQTEGSSSGTPYQGQQRQESSYSGSYQQVPSRHTHHHHHHTHQAQYTQQPSVGATSNPYGFVPVHNMTPQALSRALQGTSALGRSGSMRAVSSRSQSVMSNTSVSSQRRSAKGTPQQAQQQALLPVAWDSRSPATRGIPGRPYQTQTSKLGSASSRVALSGLLSRGSNMSATSMDKGMNVDFRPRWR